MTLGPAWFIGFLALLMVCMAGAILPAYWSELMQKLLRGAEIIRLAVQQARQELTGPLPPADPAEQQLPLTLVDLQQQLQQATAATLEAVTLVVGQQATAQSNALTAQSQALQTALTTGLAQKLNITGGTLTGPLNVQAPATAANPLQYSALPTSMAFQQTLPVVALGGLYSFTVTVQNAQVGQVAVLNLPPSLLNGGTAYQAAVTAANTVTVTLKAGVAIAAGTQTFYLRVFR